MSIVMCTSALNTTTTAAVSPDQVGGTFVYSEQQAAMQKRNGHPAKTFDQPDYVRNHPCDRGRVPYTEILPKGTSLEDYQKRWPDGEARGVVTEDSKIHADRPKKTLDARP